MPAVIERFDPGLKAWMEKDVVYSGNVKVIEQHARCGEVVLFELHTGYSWTEVVRRDGQSNGGLPEVPRELKEGHTLYLNTVGENGQLTTLRVIQR